MVSTTHTGYTKTDKSGAWAVALGAAVWGLFWIPLRMLDETGVTGLWAVSLVLLTALVPALFISYRTQELHALCNPDSWLVGVALGLATVLYFIAVLYSDIVRVIFLFYLLPLWTTLSARLIYGEPVRGTQVIVIAAALIGVWLLLGGGTALPLPANIGDWCAIAAGLCWGVSLSLLRGRQQTSPFLTTTTTIASGFLLAVAAAFVVQFLNPDGQGTTRMPDAHTWLSVMPVAFVFGTLILFPAMLSQIWGARRIPAPTAALLTMTEIVVATGSAGLLIGTELAPVSLLGGAVIFAAACLDLSIQRQDLQRSTT